MLFEVEGWPGGQWEVDLRRPSRWFRLGNSGEWLIRLTIPSALLAEVLTDPDGWETLGISYKLNLFMKKGARAKEGLLNRLMYTPSPGWMLRCVLSPRFSEFLLLRRKECLTWARTKLQAYG